MRAAKARRVCPVCGYRYDASTTRCVIDGSALVALEDPLRGRLLGGRYRVGDELGAGSMATVYEGVDTQTGAIVAIKVADEEALGDGIPRARFEREGRVGRSLRHPNLVATLDVGCDAETLFLVMERLRGETLAARLTRGALPVEVAVTLGAQLAEALSALHGQGVVHRDVKPSNVFLVEGSPSARLLDLGVAHADLDDALTASRALLGTARTMSPEQARGERATAASDLYALGAVLFEMLTGAAVFRGNDLAMRRAHVGLAAPRVRSLRPEVGEDLDELVDVMLSKSPASRPPSAAHVAKLLASMAVGAPDEGTRALGAYGSTEAEGIDVSVEGERLERCRAGFAALDAQWRALAPTLDALSRLAWIEGECRRVSLALAGYAVDDASEARRRHELTVALLDEERRSLIAVLRSATVCAASLGPRVEALVQLTEDVSVSLRGVVRGTK
jgi:tRNA A-37 threonylcarbamoyl transferase component Bud32